MADEQFALSPSMTPPPTEADYEAIFAAVMETMRGRWFLAEYAKRNRNADTDAILAALARVEEAVRETRPVAAPPASPAERVRIDLLEMAKAIDRTRSEIAAIKPEGDHKGSLVEATEELDSIVHTTERATSDILAAAEQVQEIAWTLREHGTDGDSCDALDRRAADIYTACSFQDLTGQRTRKVVEAMRFLETRIKSMIDIWGDTVADAPLNGAAAPQIHDAPGTEHLDQPHIDEMMPHSRPTEPADAPDPSRLEPAIEPAEAAVAESSPPERWEPEPPAPERAAPAPTAPDPVDPGQMEAARSHPIEPERAEPERADQGRLEASRADVMHLEAAPPAAERPEPEKVAPQAVDSQGFPPAPDADEPVIVEETEEEVAWPDAEPVPQQPLLTPVIVPAVAAVGATVLELSPPEIGPVDDDAAELDVEAAADSPSRTDPAAVLARILAIIHEPIEAPAELPIVGAAPAEQERAAVSDDAVTPLTLAATPVRVGAPAGIGVPSPDYSFASSDRHAAMPAPSARPAPAGIEDIPFASYSGPGSHTVADVVDEMLLDMQVEVEMAELAPADPTAKTAPVDPPVARFHAAAPGPLPMPEAPATTARTAAPPPVVMPLVAGEPEPFAELEPAANPERKAEPIAETQPIVPVPAAPRPLAVPIADAELAWMIEPEAAAELEPAAVATEPPIPAVASQPDRRAPAGAEPLIEMREAAAAPIEPAPAAAPAPIAPREEPTPVSTPRPSASAGTPAPPPAPPRPPTAETVAPVRMSPKPALAPPLPEPAAPPVQRVAVGAAKPRHPGLAAIAALSDDDKIALFS